MKDEVRGLLEQARNGDEEAFSQIYTLYRNSVFSKARKMMQNDANAQDVVQETFIIVHKNLYQLRDLDLFYSWLMQITVSRCQMHFRKEKHYAKHEYDDTMLAQRENRPYLDPVKKLNATNEREILLRLIDSLAPKKAIVVKMAYLEEMRMDEIAQVLGVNVNTVKTRAKRGREDLRKLIEAYEKKEQVNLHADLLLPVTFYATVLHTSLFSTLMKQCTKVLDYAKQNLLISGCCTTLGVLAISGTVFIVEDYQKQPPTSQTEPIPQPESQGETDVKNDRNEVENPANIETLTTQKFTPITYGEEELQSAREAYFVCLNFAETQADFEQLKQVDLLAIQPVYEALKSSNSPYYYLLENAGWSALFEQALTQ